MLWHEENSHVRAHRREAMCFCMAMMSFTAVVLYAGQYVIESFDAGDRVETQCTVADYEVLSSVCIVEDCRSLNSERDCFARQEECFMVKYDLTFFTLNNIGVTGRDTPDVAYQSYELAAAAADAKLHNQLPCWYTPRQPGVTLQEPVFKSSLVPVVMFGALFLVGAACTVNYRRLSNRDE